MTALLVVTSGGFAWGLAAKPPEEGGGLILNSDPPGATAYLDGKLRGRTPLALGPLPAGDHRLKLVLYGHDENNQLITVVAGQTVTVNVHLNANPNIQGLPASTDRPPDATSEAPAGATAAPASSSEPKSQATRRSGGWLSRKKKLLLVGVPVVVGGGVAGYLIATKNHAPTAGPITVDPANVVGLASVTAFHLNAQARDADNNTLSYMWDFGDGTFSTDAAPTHTYQGAGTYAVRVTVSDRKLTAQASTSLTVAALDGAWNGTLSTGASITLVLVQQGTGLTGTLRYNATELARSVRGQVTAPRAIQLTFDDSSDARLTGTVGDDAKTISGGITIAGASAATLTVQR